MLKNLQHSTIRFFLLQTSDYGLILMKELYFGYLVNLMIEKLGFRLSNIEAEIVYPFETYYNYLMSNLLNFDEEYFVFYFENSYHSNHYGYHYIKDCLDILQQNFSEKKVILFSTKTPGEEAKKLVEMYPEVVLFIRTEIEYFFWQYFGLSKDLRTIANILYREEGNLYETDYEDVSNEVGDYIIGSHYSGVLDKFKRSKDFISLYATNGLTHSADGNNYRFQQDIETMISTGRGCRYKCTYCYRGAKYSKVRLLSLTVIQKDLDYLATNKYESIYVYDDCFLTSNYNRIDEVIDLFNSYSLFKYGLSIRYEMCQPHIFEKLDTLNLYRVQIGLQSTSIKTNKETGRNFNKERFTKIVKKFREKGVKVSIDLILGMPGETIKDFIVSLNFAASLDPGAIHINRLFLNPGTKLYENKEQYGIITYGRNPKFTVDHIEESDTFSKKDFILAEHYVTQLKKKLSNTYILLR